MVATLSGYKEALAKSDDVAVSALCQDMIELRSDHHRDVHPLLEKAGETVDDGTTIMSKIQETVIDVRAMITGIDKDTLPSFIRGEESIAGKYDDAIEEAKTPTFTHDLLLKQKVAVMQMIVRMKCMTPA